MMLTLGVEHIRPKNRGRGQIRKDTCLATLWDRKGDDVGRGN